MHDTLAYFQQEPIHRRYHHGELTFSMVYAFDENFILPLSHDEVVHGKRSLLEKMPGDRWQQMANLRALYAYMWAHPGKQLLFMGGELAQEREWSEERSLDWHLLERADHAGVQTLVRDLNHCYRRHPALWEIDDDPAGFTWLEAADADRNVVAFVRRSADDGQQVVCVANLSPVPRDGLPGRAAGRRALDRGPRHRRLGLRRLQRRQPRGRRRRGGAVARPGPLRHHDPPAPRRPLVRVRRDASVLRFEHPLGATALRRRCRRAAAGADRRRGGAVDFRVWAPAAEEVVVRLLTGAAAGDHPTVDAGMGVRTASVPAAAAGDDYVFVLDGEPLPDPASRHQPEGVRGPSRVVDPAAFAWSDDGFAIRPLAEHVLYELHVGTFSAEGTFDGAIGHLAGLADLGVTAIELMPVAEFPGRWGWGYDGVYLGAAHSTYGGPEGLARLVDAAHAAGLAVILDVVYNHLGATGAEQVAAFGPYFTDKYPTWWGAALNYDDEWSDPVREWVLQSAEWWLRDLHVDGLRVDAVHAIVDQGAEHLVAAVARRAHRRPTRQHRHRRERAQRPAR